MSNTSVPNEKRIINENELALISRLYRDTNKLTQETLAELAKISLRTIQRVENSERSDPHTRRALARVFEAKDIDAFNKPQLIPTIEQIRQKYEQLEKNTITKSLEKVSSGRQLRELVDKTMACAFDQLSELTKDAEQVFAEIQDYIRDYACIKSEFPATEKLKVNQAFQQMIDSLTLMGFSIGIFTRVLLYKTNEKYQTPMHFNTIYFVIGPAKNFPEIIRVSREESLSF